MKERALSTLIATTLNFEKWGQTLAHFIPLALLKICHHSYHDLVKTALILANIKHDSRWLSANRNKKYSSRLKTGFVNWRSFLNNPDWNWIRGYPRFSFPTSRRRKKSKPSNEVLNGVIYFSAPLPKRKAGSNTRNTRNGPVFRYFQRFEPYPS